MWLHAARLKEISTEPIDPHALPANAFIPLVKQLRAETALILSRENLAKDPYYKSKLSRFVGTKDTPWLHFDDILRCDSLNKMGFYPGVEHYPFLEEAAATIAGVNVCE